MRSRASFLLSGVLALAVPAAAHAQSTADLAKKARALEDGGRLAESLAVWEEARDLAPEDEDVRGGLARVHACLGVERFRAVDAAGARAHLAISVALRPKVAQYHYLLARAYHLDDESEQARGEVETAVALDAAHAGGLELLGQLEYEAGRLDRAIELWKETLAREKDRPGTRHLLVKAERERAIEENLALLSTQHFQLRFPGDAENVRVAERAGRVLEEAYASLGASLGVHPRGVVTVLLYPPDDFQAVTGSHDWVAALYDGKIRIPLTADLADDGALRSVAVHEFVHALVTSRTRRCPTWLHEGLAQHYEGRVAEPRALASLSAGGTLLPFAKLGAGFTELRNREQVDAVYLQSLGFTRFLLDLRGPAEVAAVLTELARGASLDEALERSYGEGLSELEARWRRGLDAGFRWRR